MERCLKCGTLYTTNCKKCAGEPSAASAGYAPIDSLVGRNLMEHQGYSPYCGADRCHFTWPRTSFDGEQFKCRCGWRSSFPAEFIAEYKAKWGR